MIIFFLHRKKVGIFLREYEVQRCYLVKPNLNYKTHNQKQGCNFHNSRFMPQKLLSNHIHIFRWTIENSNMFWHAGYQSHKFILAPLD